MMNEGYCIEIVVVARPEGEFPALLVTHIFFRETFTHIFEEITVRTGQVLHFYFSLIFLFLLTNSNAFTERSKASETDPQLFIFP